MRVSLVLVALLLLAAVPAAAQDALTAGGLEQQIRALREQARYADAVEPARELLAMRKADPEAKPYEIADAEQQLETLQDIADLPEKGRRELALADSLTEVVALCRAEGRYSDGAAAARRQLEMRRAHLVADHLDIARSLNDLGVLLQADGDYANSEMAQREALAMRRRLLSGNHPDIAVSLNDLADVLRTRCDYEEARALFAETLRMRMRLYGEQHLEVATTLNNLTVLFQEQGDYAAAEPLARRSLAMMRNLSGSDDITVATTLNNLAALLWYQSDYAGAEPLFRETLEMLIAMFGDENPYVAATLNNLAVLLQSAGDLAGAESLYREALAMRKKLLGDEHPDVAQSVNNLAGLLDERGDHETAEPLLREALAMRRKLLGDDHADVGDSLDDLALCLQAQDDYAGAEALYREVTATRRKLLGDEHPDVASSLGNLAALLQAKGDRAEAEPLLAEAARIFDIARTRAGAGLERATFRSSPYPRLAALRLSLGRMDEAWPAAEKGQARALADLLFAADERELSPSEAAREDSLKDALRGLEGELAAYAEVARSDTTREARALVETTRNALLSAEAEWSVFQQAIAAKYPVTEGQAYELARVQSALPEHAAIIGWLDVDLGEDEYESWCYVVRSSGPVKWARVESPQGAVSYRSPFERARSFREDLVDPASSHAGVTRECRQLWRERIEPVLPALESVASLIVIPSGAMLGVPIEALADTEGEPSVERYSVSYTPSATIYTWLAERTRGETGSGVLLVGDPPYTAAHVAEMDREEHAHLASAPDEAMPPPEILRSALAGNETALAALPRLPATRQEVTALTGLFGECTVLLGPEATEQELVRLVETGELAGFGTIHMATHALVDCEQPERSALVLSQVDLPDPLESAMAGTRFYDGVVTAEEILREWDLNADLVTLSACETGLGKDVAGEGYVGFAHAFLQAGARSLIVSLWRVEDRATSLLMHRFYENRFGSSKEERDGQAVPPMRKAEALREAKLWLRTYTDENGHRPYAHPYYWSAFVLIGDPS